MSQQHRYQLEQYKGMKSRHKCLACNHNGKFARYIDTETSQYLGDNVGRCERADKCGYHYSPKQFFADNGIVPDYSISKDNVIVEDKPVSFIDKTLLDKTLTNYNENNFIIYLNTLFDKHTVDSLIDRFKIGTSKHWNGSTVFWQIDVDGKIRSGKVMQYDSNTGKRIKTPFDKITWAHKITKAKDFNLKQCLFGEHQLIDNYKPIAVTESEKTSIIASGYLPQFTWVAAGNLEGLSVDKCNTLQKFSKANPVILYPDLKSFNKWNVKAKQYNFKISDLLENNAADEEKEKGLDLADYLVRFKVSDFVKPTEPEIIPERQSNELATIPTQPQKLIVEEWVIPSFEGLHIPVTLRLDPATFIFDVKTFIDTNKQTIIANNGKRAFKPYFSRLQQVHSLISCQA